MSFFSRLLYRQMEKGFQEIAGATGIDIIGSQGKVPDFSAEEAIKQYKSWAYVSGTKNAVATSSAPLRLFATRGTGQEMPKIAPYAPITKQRQLELKAASPLNSPIRNSADIVEITEHPFLELMSEPNPFRTEKAFRQETSLFADLTGDAFWWMMTGTGVESGIPKQLWLLPTQMVRIVPDKTTFIKGYLYGRALKRQALTPEEVMHIRRPNPGDLWYGKGRVAGAWDAIHGSEALDQYENSTARNPLPQLLLKYKGEVNAGKRRAIMRESERVLDFQARSQSHIAGVYDSDVTIEKLSFAPKEVVALQGRKWYRQNIVEAFGQTLSLYDTQAARATIEGAIYLWARFELDPTNQLIAEKINRTIIPMYDAGDRMFCAFDPITQEDAEFALKRDTEDIGANIRTVNEVRSSRGLSLSLDERADDLFSTSAVPPNNNLELDDPNDPGANKTSKTNSVIPGCNRPSGSRPTFDGKIIHPDLENVPIWLS